MNVDADIPERHLLAQIDTDLKFLLRGGFAYLQPSHAQAGTNYKIVDMKALTQSPFGELTFPSAPKPWPAEWTSQVLQRFEPLTLPSYREVLGPGSRFCWVPPGQEMSGKMIEGMHYGGFAYLFGTQDQQSEHHQQGFYFTVGTISDSVES
eukprot:gnl/MRDRNA2_/MRDRNA2_224313_c0_seq1.p1 gnl/MRDRNA2_/MRDRNA2_224313_c0~~gnl/MRDRNA2_/MRDRNA2_224313_c0_seq1.p1  ORF type:complete len:151 (+),score=9.73 gnl/MRDRNA2_/MRDRNA2_224313_c0_seq1:1-453(+)